MHSDADQQLSTDELAREIDTLAASLPAMRHIPTITLDKAIQLAVATRTGGTPDQRQRLLDLMRYSCEHAAKFTAAVQRIETLRKLLIPDGLDDGYEPNLHPLLSYREVMALLKAQQAFHLACAAFVDSDDRSNEPLKAAFAKDLLAQLDAAASEAGEHLHATMPQGDSGR